MWLISPTFYERIWANTLAPKKVQTLNESTKKLCQKISYGKAARKMLVKLTPGRLKTLKGISMLRTDCVSYIFFQSFSF
jgi:hypothetical protein